MKEKSLFKNVIYNFIYTGLNLLFPLITAPYVSRVLGASNLGNVNFASAVINWFLIFAVFGTTTYGVREVAKRRNDHVRLNKLFSEIIIINGICSLIVLVVYYVAIFNIPKFSNELPLFLIMSLNIILNMVAIDWFFQGIEKYRYITVRNAIVKVISLIFLFLFVRQADHYVIYGLISVIVNGINGILNYTYSKKFVKLQFKNINLMVHFKPLSIFFIHSFIVHIYTNLDQVLLGFMNDTKSVAFMNRAKMVTTMAISVSTAITNVTLPRASYYMEYDKEKFRVLLGKVPNFILWVTIPITIGCIALSSNIMFLLGGEEFLEATVLLQVMSLTIIFSPLSTYLQYQVLVAAGKENMGLYCAIITSFISLILNILLIPKIGFIAAGIVQVLSEMGAVAMRYYIVKRNLGYKEVQFINKSSISYLSAGLIMGAVVIYIRMIINNILLSFILGSIVGAFIYITILLLTRENVTRLMLGKITSRFK